MRAASTVFDGLPLDVVPVPPGLVVAFLLAVIVCALLYAHQPPVPQTMAIAFLPWVAAGSLVHVLATGGGYPSTLVPLVTVPGAYLTALLVPGIAWSALLNVSVSRRALPAYHHYIGTMGAGVVLVLWLALLLTGEAAGLPRMLVLLMVPVVSFLAAGLISFLVGLWSPDFIEHTPFVGGFVILASLVNAISTAMGVVGGRAHTVATSAALDVVVRYASGGLGPLDESLLWVSLFLAANALVGVAVATGLARFADVRPRTVYSLLGVVGVVWFALGFNRLIVVVVA